MGPASLWRPGLWVQKAAGLAWGSPTLGFSFVRSYLFSDRFSTCRGEARSYQTSRSPGVGEKTAALLPAVALQVRHRGLTYVSLSGSKTQDKPARVARPCLGVLQASRAHGPLSEDTIRMWWDREVPRGLHSGCYGANTCHARFLKRSLSLCL